MLTVADVFDAFKGPTALGRAIGLNPSTASEMKRRNSIPSEYWVDLVAEAQKLGLDQITHESLAFAHAVAKGRIAAPETVTPSREVA